MNMVQRRISEAQRWQIIGMRSSGLSYKAIGRHMGYHNTVVSRLVRKHIQTNNVKDLQRSGRPLVTLQREDRALRRLIRRMPLATSHVLKREWLSYRQLSTKTLRNRLKSAGLKSKRVIRRPMFTDRHQQLHLAWCLAYLGHVRSSGIGSRTTSTKFTSVGSSIAPGMAANTTAGNPTTNWRD